jgi:hypothetical protein
LDHTDKQMKKFSSFSLENYELLFSSVFTNETVKTAFKNFLKSEFNLEPFLFILEVEELESIAPEKQLQKSISILKKYIQDEAEFQINISFDKKKEILKLYEIQQTKEIWILEETPIETFDQITKIIKQELNYDPFKRFVRTKICSELMEKFYKETSIVAPKILKSFEYNMDSFKDPFIEDLDFEFALSLMADNYSWDVS